MVDIVFGGKDSSDDIFGERVDADKIGSIVNKAKKDLGLVDRRAQEAIPQSFLDLERAKIVSFLSQADPGATPRFCDLDVRDVGGIESSILAKQRATRLAENHLENLKGFREKPDLFDRFELPRSIRDRFMKFPGASPGYIVLTPTMFDNETAARHNIGSQTYGLVVTSDTANIEVNIHHNDGLSEKDITRVGRDIDTDRGTNREATAMIVPPCYDGNDISPTAAVFKVPISMITKAMEDYLFGVQGDQNRPNYANAARALSISELYRRILIYVKETDSFISFGDMRNERCHYRNQITTAIKEARAWLVTLSGDVPEFRQHDRVYRITGQAYGDKYYVLDNLGIHEVYSVGDIEDALYINRVDLEKKVSGFERLLADSEEGYLMVTDGDPGSVRPVCIVSTDRERLEKLQEERVVRLDVERTTELKGIIDQKNTELNDMHAKLKDTEREVHDLRRDLTETKKATMARVNEEKTKQAEIGTKQAETKQAVEEVKAEASIKSSDSATTVEKIKMVGVLTTAVMTVALAGFKLKSAMKKSELAPSLTDWGTVMTLTSTTTTAGSVSPAIVMGAIKAGTIAPTTAIGMSLLGVLGGFMIGAAYMSGKDVTLKEMLAPIGKWLISVKNKAVEYATRGWAWTKRTAKAGWKKAKEWGSSAVEVVSEIGSNIVDSVCGFASSCWNTVFG